MLFPSLAGAYLAPGPSVPGVGGEPASVQTGDLNGDGRTDLVVPNAGSGNVSILLGNSSGGFTPAVGSPVKSDGLPGSPEPVAAAIAPLNHDTIPDVALVNKGTDDISIMLGNGTGRFSFAPGSPEASGVGGEEPVAVTSGDFNSDGTIDLAVANKGSNDVGILANDGAGGFTASSVSLGGGAAP
jgi:VCBS repeat protein/FG-GAP repeat protein